MNLNIYLYLLLLFLSLLSINLLGKFIILFSDRKTVKSVFRVFIELFIGLVAVVVIYSCVISGFKTINILFLFLLFYYIFIIDRKAFKIPIKKDIVLTFSSIHKDALIIFLSSIPFFLYELYYIYSNNNCIVPDMDYFFYAQLSDSLNFFGHENKSLSLNILFPTQSQGMIPYHYFEIWINSFIARFANTPSIFSLLLITYPLLNTIVFLGLVSIWELYKKPVFYSYIIVFFFIFVAGVWLPFYNGYKSFFDFNLALLSSPFAVFGEKLSAVYLFFVQAILTYIKGYKKLSFLVIGAITIVYIGVAPGIFGGVFCFLLLNRFHKSLNKNEIKAIAAFFILLAFMFYLVYFKLQTTSYSSNYVANNNILSKLIANPFLHENYKIIFGDIWYKFTRSFILYFPLLFSSICLLFLVLKHKKSIYQLALLVLLINILALFATGFAGGLMDAGQFFSNTLAFTNVIIILILIASLICVFQNKKNIKTNIGIAFCVLSFIFIVFNIYYNTTDKAYRISNKYSKGYCTKVIEKTQKNEILLCACLYSDSDYEKNNFAWIYRAKPGLLIQYSYGYRDLININSYRVFEKADSMPSYDKYYLENSELFLFVKHQKETGLFRSYEESQIDFIKEYNIKYLFANKDVQLSASLKKMVQEEITDSKSGERFYLLK